jgi:hypothetical protein
MSAHGTLKEEEFENFKFVENNVPFVILLGKTWIVKDQMQRKQEEENSALTRRTRELVEATKDQRYEHRS